MRRTRDALVQGRTATVCRMRAWILGFYRAPWPSRAEVRTPLPASTTGEPAEAAAVRQPPGGSSGSGSGSGSSSGSLLGGDGGGGSSRWRQWLLGAATDYVYVLSAENELYSFAPNLKKFTLIGTLGCQTAMQPNSMAVDRNANAYVNYFGPAGGVIYKVSTTDASCGSAPVVNLPAGWTASAWATRPSAPRRARRCTSTASAPRAAQRLGPGPRRLRQGHGRAHRVVHRDVRRGRGRAHGNRRRAPLRLLHDHARLRGAGRQDQRRHQLPCP